MRSKSPKTHQQTDIDTKLLLARIQETTQDLESLIKQPDKLHECAKTLRKSYTGYKRQIPNILRFKNMMIQVVQEYLKSVDSSGESSSDSQPVLNSKQTTPNNKQHEDTKPQVAVSKKRHRTEESQDVKMKTKRQKSYVVVERPSARFSDCGGIEAILDDVRKLVQRPFQRPEIYRALGVEPSRGILLHGPPGCGKTLLAHAIAGELGVPFLKISAPEIVSSMSGQSELKIRNLFKDAVENAPSIIFIDEIDAITRKRESANREMEVRIVAQLITCMDGLSFEKTGGKMVLVIGATNRPDVLDPGLRRAGRFDREIALGMPDEDARRHILQLMTKKLKVSGDLDFKRLAKLTPGYVGADLQALTAEAAQLAIDRIFTNLKPTDKLNPEQLEKLSITMQDFEKAVKKVQPSAMREGFMTIPDVTWKDIGALEDVREELIFSIVEPIDKPEKFKRLGLTAPTGVLLYGPPGCGKTLLAKAIANECGANFISVKGPELLNKYVGESERAVRLVYQRARSSAPCVIFFDELDSLCPKRGSDGSNASTERVVNQLLTEMDGIESRKGVFVIGATNRPDIIDPAMLRPGRLDKLLHVPLPNYEARIAILNTIARKTPIDSTVDFKKLAERTDGFSGADIGALVREAAVCCYREWVIYEKESDSMQTDAIQVKVTMKHFEQALKKVQPSVSEKDRKMYEKMREQLRAMIARN